MANYRYDKHDFFPTWYVTENNTGYVVSKGLPYDTAKQMTKQLNAGAAFNGFTPEFFLTDSLKISFAADELSE